MRKPDTVSLIAAVMILLVVAGGILAYFDNPGIYGAEGTATSTGSDFKLNSSITTEYVTLAIDNGTETPVSKLYIFIDSEYVPYCANHSSADSAITQFEKELSRRGFDNFVRVNAEKLAVLMQSSSAVGEGILIPFGTLPDTVYTGDPSDDFKQWTAKGGTVYWAGGIPGKYTVSKGEDAVRVPSYEAVFPFAEGGSTSTSYANEYADTLSSKLSLLSSDTSNALSPDYPGVIGMGLKTSDGKCTVSAVKEGSGTFFVIGGGLNREERHDLSAIVAAGITYESELIDYEEGSFKGQISGTLEYTEPNVSVYVAYGGYFPVYGKRIIG